LVWAYLSFDADREFSPWVAALNADDDAQRYLAETPGSIKVRGGGTLTAIVIRPRGSPKPGPALLEYQSPTAALIARPVPAASRHVIWVIALMFAVVLAVVTLLPIDRVVQSSGKVTSLNGNLTVQPLDVSAPPATGPDTDRGHGDDRDHQQQLLFGPP